MNTNVRQTIRRVLHVAPAAALTAGIVCPAALGDSGDLDPTFASVGRFTPPDDFQGVVQSFAIQDDNYVFAGGELEYDFYYYFIPHGFAGRVSADGALDAAFAAPDLADTLTIDMAIQPDGKTVGVGTRADGLVVYRLEHDGAFDATFGVGGVVALTNVTSVGSVAVDPAGTIVVAASRGAELKVLRLLANGDPDDTFGTTGVFTAPAEGIDERVQVQPRVLRMDDGSYRVTDNDFNDTTGATRCRVLALTADGAIDESFGDHGYAGLASTGGVLNCDSMVRAGDGGLLVSGADGLKPVLVKLIAASGAPDPAFTLDPLLSTAMIEAAAIDVDPASGAIAVAGYGPADTAGFPVVRLQADGSLDPQFGSGGQAWVDVPQPSQHLYPVVVDVSVLPNSDIVVAGGMRENFSINTPFIARLVGGDDSRDGPGVIGVSKPFVEATESGQQAVVTVRRIGGKTGSVSVAYQTQAGSPNLFHATEGDDFTASADRLTWADGDVADKQIVVPIVVDGGASEESEDFDVELSDVQGGAGLGTSLATVTIASDAPPQGMFAIESGDVTVNEQDGTAQAYVSRGYSSVGAVSVTVTLMPDTATAGDDFDGDAVTVTWADGDSDPKLVEIPIVNNLDHESTEEFTMQLSDPTGGAIVGPRATSTVTIVDNDLAPPPSSGGGGGGGSLGLGSLLSLGLLRWARHRRQRRAGH